MDYIGDNLFIIYVFFYARFTRFVLVSPAYQIIRGVNGFFITGTVRFIRKQSFIKLVGFAICRGYGIS